MVFVLFWRLSVSFSFFCWTFSWTQTRVDMSRVLRELVDASAVNPSTGALCRRNQEHFFGRIETESSQSSSIAMAFGENVLFPLNGYPRHGGGITT